VSWRNPHGSITIEVTSAEGDTTDWLIETGSISAAYFDYEGTPPAAICAELRYEAGVRTSPGSIGRPHPVRHGELQRTAGDATIGDLFACRTNR
jgi:hypothetical protein